ncbi:alpha/beta hydrolase [Candidatus Saccharibacteria bacterium]|nr:alpha/beta hydrolase [Candidatus Saccharibacteria bacterium]
MPSRELSLQKTHDRQVTHPKLVVVMIHGIASDSSSFNHALKFLENVDSLKNIRFVTFDLLGSGQSLKSDELNYDYKDQLEALYNSIEKLNLGQTPLVLVGHSLGTFIVTRYADTYKNTVKKLVLISPPVYTEDDLENPAFEKGIQLFKDAVSLKDREILQEKSFSASMENIVLDRKNYVVLSKLKTPTILIYGSLDRFIAHYNLPKLLKTNPEYLSAIRTDGRHGVTRDKYTKLVKILEEMQDAKNL